MNVDDLIRRQDALLSGYEGETVELCGQEFKKKFKSIAEDILLILKDMKMATLQPEEMERVFQEEYNKRVANILLTNRGIVTRYKNNRTATLSDSNVLDKGEELVKREHGFVEELGAFEILEKRPDDANFNLERDTVFDPIIGKCIETITSMACKANNFDVDSAKGEQIKMELGDIIKKGIKEVAKVVVNILIEKAMTVLHVTNGQILEANSQDKMQSQEPITQVANGTAPPTDNFFVSGGPKPLSYEQGLNDIKSNISADAQDRGKQFLGSRISDMFVSPTTPESQLPTAAQAASGVASGQTIASGVTAGQAARGETRLATNNFLSEDLKVNSNKDAFLPDEEDPIGKGHR